MLQTATKVEGPRLPDIGRAAQRLRGRIVATPVVALASDRARPFLPEAAEITVKLELFQHAGSFKARGALLNVDALDDAARKRGVTTVSAGNHALATSWAAGREGVHAKVVMPKSADPVRVTGCRALGAEVILVDDVHEAFDEVDRIVENEGRFFIHPFESPITALGTATCGFEFARQAADLEAVVIPIGGGGLIGGMACAFKQISPGCRVIGVEPEGADTMHRSFQAGSPQSIPKVQTIADSLGAPMALPYSFGLARDHVDRLVRIRDDEMLQAMALLYDALKIAVEPAGAAATAAIMGPLCKELDGKRVGVIACGANIGESAFANFVTQGRALLAARKPD